MSVEHDASAFVENDASGLFKMMRVGLLKIRMRLFQMKRVVENEALSCGLESKNPIRTIKIKRRFL